MTAALCPPASKICARRTPGSFPLACPILLVLQVLAKSLTGAFQDGFVPHSLVLGGPICAPPAPRASRRVQQDGAQPPDPLTGALGALCHSRESAWRLGCAEGGVFGEPGKGLQVRREPPLQRGPRQSWGLARGPKICQGWELAPVPGEMHQECSVCH